LLTRLRDYNLRISQVKMKQELEIKHTRHIDFYHGSVKPVMLAYSMLWCSKGKGLQPTLLK
jgi:hypothetical protein